MFSSAVMKYAVPMLERMRWQANRLDAGVPENIAKPFTELGVPIHQQITLANQEALVGSNQVPSDLLHPRIFGAYCRTGEMNSAGRQLHDDEEIGGDRR